jgi:hypothetical protein
MGQSVLCFLTGRSSKFRQSFAVVRSCRGKYLINLQVSYPFFVFIWFYKGSGFFNITRLLLEYCLLSGDNFSFLCSVLFCKRCVSICLLYLSPVCLLWVCWVRGNSLAGRVIYCLCVCGSAVWSAGPVQFNSGTLLEWLAGLYRFFLLAFLSSGSAVAGTVQLNWCGGVVCFYFSLSSVCCHFSWRMDVCGRIFVLYFFFWFSLVDLWYCLAVSHFVSC